MRAITIEARLAEISRAARYVDRKTWKRRSRRILFLGLIAYVIAAGLVGWLMSMGVL